LDYISNNLLAYSEIVESIQCTRKKDELVEIIRKPRAKVIKRKEMRQTIFERVKDLDIIIRESISAMVVLMKKDHPHFAKQFANATVIIDRHNRRTPSITPNTDGHVPFDSD